MKNKEKQYINAIKSRLKEIEAIQKKEEINHCVKCGKEIMDYEDTEFLQQEGIMKFTYKCDCGFYGEQIFDVTYNRTEEI